MDTTASDITFDEQGVCNYCTEFLERSSHIIHEDPVQKEARLNALVSKIKEAGRGKPYDCIVGVSGGVDSSWTLVEVKRLGLRPLAVHMDNGWNSELAQNNIANLVNTLGVDLYTHVIDWEEYRALMQAFFDADVIDIELLYDNAMLAVNYQQANKYGLKYILAGTNQATEGMRMPPGWNWLKYDKKNIVALARRNGIKSLDTFPAIGIFGYIYYQYFRRNRWLSFLDYLPYNKFYALNELETNYGYKRYPFKHYESIFTRFYQGYILPRKFGVDKRKLHLATLVASNQMTRDEAIKGLEGIPYPTQQGIEADLNYFLKKMHWTRQQLDEYIARPSISHSAYPSEKATWEIFVNIYRSIVKGRYVH
ncbi:N-acetyl sugar amidotransferase [Candidatus Thiothrix anitrata]|uniref:N-acetyl sugar amidotransferase n=2 Tax=Candidatus Thiothrix anitrata TaxID=2823902 RepID=A0ABX7X8Z4_9GAMM|nr:N-acetyl sugar amidotransferase [Candidatus Thiothrix anitrata]